MPFLMPRIIGKNFEIGKEDGLVHLVGRGDESRQGRLGQLRGFFYETAQQANAISLGALRKVVPATQILFGTDFPYTSIQQHVTGLRECGVFNSEELRAIEYENVYKMFPKFKV
jgi:hypothetical protein